MAEIVSLEILSTANRFFDIPRMFLPHIKTSFSAQPNPNRLGFFYLKFMRATILNNEISPAYPTHLVLTAYA